MNADVRAAAVAALVEVVHAECLADWAERWEGSTQHGPDAHRATAERRLDALLASPERARAVIAALLSEPEEERPCPACGAPLAEGECTTEPGTRSEP